MMKADARQLVERFAESIVKQLEATFAGDVKTAVYQGKRRLPIAKRLMRLGDEAKEQFATLFQHPNRIVRVAAAVYLFSSMPERTVAALREIAEGHDFAAHCAELRIKQWEEHPEQYDDSNWA